jgi:hypothetical protein
VDAVLLFEAQSIAGYNLCSNTDLKHSVAAIDLLQEEVAIRQGVGPIVLPVGPAKVPRLCGAARCIEMLAMRDSD